MKIVIWATLYLVIGMVVAIGVSKYFRKVRGYSVRKFDDLKSEEQAAMRVAIFLWPIAILISILQLILDIITKIANRKDDS